MSTPSALPGAAARAASRVDWPAAAADVEHAVARAHAGGRAQPLVVAAQLVVVVVDEPQPRPSGAGRPPRGGPRARPGGSAPHSGRRRSRRARCRGARPPPGAGSRPGRSDPRCTGRSGSARPARRRAATATPSRPATGARAPCSSPWWPARAARRGSSRRTGRRCRSARRRARPAPATACR